MADTSIARATDYDRFLASKLLTAPAVGLTDVPALHPQMFDFQRDITRWALRRGRAAIFADCGLGKTFMQQEWARVIASHTGKPVLILAPLAVAEQSEREAARFGIPAVYARKDTDAAPIVITNYEMLPHFDVSRYAGVVVDESSILKAFDGATRTAIIDAFAHTPYKLACTATPAPNDHMELGNHAEFLGVMSRAEMLATFFCHDGGETQSWRLKGHAERDFWAWLASWAVMMRSPADLGYDATGYELPPLNVIQETVGATTWSTDTLFAMDAQTLSERIGARRDTVKERAARVAELVRKPGPWLVWCGLNAEADELRRLVPESVEVRGSDEWDKKRDALLSFGIGQTRVLITKPSIAGFGMNWQHCSQVAFLGVSDSWEQYYQAIRRCWRFGQTQSVTVHVIASDREGAVVANLKRKDAQAAEMARELVEHMKDLNTRALHAGAVRTVDAYEEGVAQSPDGRWTLYRGDCVEQLAHIQSDTIGYSIHSPPFASLYTYSASERDMGNVKSHAEFFAHYRFAIAELFRVTMPGRLASVHCMNLPTSKVRDGVIGLTDFRGQIIRAYEDAGWIYHSEVCIWKDPVTAMQRTKALGLLYKQLKKDSAMSRQGIPDYLCTFRKPGENTARVEKTPDGFPVQLWQQYASPVWMDISPSDTLQYRSAREHDDERHICPLQLGVIRRGIELWTNPGDLVLSPFAGIGSEGYIALEMGRRFVGVELKASYWRQAAKNLEAARTHSASDLFSVVGGADVPESWQEEEVASIDP